MAGLRRLRLLLASIGILAVGFGTAIAATFDGAPATPTPVKDTAAYSDLDVRYCLLDTTPGNVTILSGDSLVLQLNASGIFAAA